MDDDALDRSIQQWRKNLLRVMAGCMLLYFARFASFPLGEPDSWGQFGDFLGGVMNPLIAFGAFYWLTQSVKLQKKELAETKEALKSSQEAQTRQADLAFLTARIQTVNVRLAFVASRLSEERRHRAGLVDLMESRGSNGGMCDSHGHHVPLAGALENSMENIEILEKSEQHLVELVEKLSAEFLGPSRCDSDVQRRAY